MDYKIIIDSCGELTEQLKQDGHFFHVPLTMQVDDKNYVDDESFDQASFLADVAASPNTPKSACPSPQSYYDAFCCDAKRIYVVTLSSQLSGSYNSALVAKEMYEEDYDDKKIVVIDSKSASMGETLIGICIHEYEKIGRSFEEIVTKVSGYREEMKTYFVLENLDTLRKNGRLSKMKAMVANTLNIKPVLGSTDDGNICQLDQARGVNKALDKMIGQIMAKTENPEERTLSISHCNCYERALEVKARIEEKCKFKDIIIENTGGTSTMYANQGGIIVCV